MPLTIHHLHLSQSERLPFLCEELNIPYNLITYNRSPLLAPPEYKALHPSGAAPVIHDTFTTGTNNNETQTQTLTLAESGACVQYICHKHGGGRLFLSPEHKDYAAFLYWFHWANGSFQPLLGRLMTAKGLWGKSAAATAGATAGAGGEETGGGNESDDPVMALWHDRLRRSLEMLDKRFRSREEGGEGAKWLAGEEFTAADVMLVFSLTTFRRFWFQYGLEGYQGVLGYLERIRGREGYRRAMGRAEPGLVLEEEGGEGNKV
ncbi:hypothetical protein AJ79_00712 [Helicocarpus griseus UAMH5409]|uniref:GST C-terminal domain-containing protein n=1 Tax=Helicocarpus griseus UAMH5409 TaxID=1447875 RepID=A0A2B7Y1X9_9EURO|nr:hypothetical protein AJ79_00712 [Helicocarpus griseus UAMH5409]